MEGLVREAEAHLLNAGSGGDCLSDLLIISQYRRMSHYGRVAGLLPLTSGFPAGGWHLLQTCAMVTQMLPSGFFSAGGVWADT